MEKTKYILILMLFCFAWIPQAKAFDWSWSVNNVSSTFTASESTTTSAISGTILRLDNGFIEFEVTSSSGAQAPAIGYKFYPVEVVGFYLLIPPLLTTETQMIVSLVAGSCPGVNTDYNWVFSSWENSSDMTLSSQAAFGTFSWNIGTNTASITNIYNISSYATPSWFTQALNLDSSACSSGQSTVVGPAGTDRAGTLYLSNEAGFIYTTEANKVILGVPEQTIPSASTLSGIYAAYDAVYDTSQSVSNRIKPIRVVITQNGDVLGSKLDSVFSNSKDTGYGDIGLTVDQLNSPNDGMFQGTLSRGGNTSKVLCINYTTSSPQNMMMCSGQDETTNSLPKNLILVQQTIASSYAPFTCDSGSVSGTCTITTAKAMSDGEFLTSQNLTVGSGGSLSITGEASLEVIGTINIQNGGTITGDLENLYAYGLTIDSGGTYSGNILSGKLNSLTVSAGGVLSANGSGEAGGTGGGNGAGSCPGVGHNSGGDGASGGCHGGVSGAGESSGAAVVTYGSNTLPATKGSGGGSGQGGTVGGAGGGVLSLTVTGTATIDGTLSANGSNGANGLASTATDAAGGGSGGSIYLKVGTLAGAGTITANGGAGGSDGGASSCGGGGSGGRIAIDYDSVSFLLPNSNTTASGGDGDNTNCGTSTAASSGSSGTKYWSPDISDLVELTDTNLVGRYFLDEAASGTSPSSAFDASSNGINLTIDYDTSNLNYTSGANGRGLDFTNSDGTSSADVRVTVASTALNINGNTSAMLETVVELDSCPNSPSQLVFLGDGTNNGEFAIACDVNSLIVYTQNTERISYSVGTWSGFGRKIVHAVYDSTQGTAADRVKLYVNGAQVATASSTPSLNQTLAITTGDLFIIGNNATGTNTAQGNIYYAAMYDAALSEGYISAHAERLNANDDGDLVIATLSSSVSGSTSLTTIPMTATFSESVTGFDATDLDVTNGTVSNFSGSGTSYTFDITVPSSTVTVRLPASSGVNGSGIGNTAAIPFTFDYVGTPITTTITSSEPSGTSADPVPFTVTFSDSVLGFTSADVSVSSGTISSFSGSGTTYTFNLDAPSTGTLTVSVPAAAAASGSGVDNLAGSLTMNHGGRRRGAGLIALYEFDEGSGSTVADNSGVLPPATLLISNTSNVTWGSDSVTTTSDGGMVISGTNKLLEECEATDEFTVEAWVTPSNVTNTGTDKYIIDFAGISGSTYDPFVLINETGNDLQFEVNTYDDSTGATYPVSSNNDLSVAKKHIVVTFEGTRGTGSTNTKVLYVDGSQVATNSGNQSTTSFTPLYNWDYYQYAPYKIELGGNANSTGNIFLGEYHQVAFYCKKLDSTEVALHYALGSEAQTEPAPDNRGDLIEVNFNDIASSTSFTDISGNRAAVTCTGGTCPTSGTLGILGNMVDFDGTDDFVTSDTGSKTDYPYTVSAWIRTSDSQAGSIVFMGETANDRNFDLAINSDGTISYNFSTTTTASTNGVSLTTTDSFNDGNWHYVVAVRDGERTGRLYVDAILEGEDTDDSGSTATISGSTFYIGRNGQTDAYFSGNIDEVHVFNSALTQRQIYDDYRKIKGTTSDPDTYPLTYGSAELWIDVSDSDTVIATANNISQINDKSGNFRHLKQQDSDYRPKYVTDGINSLAVMDFDGADDYLINTDGAVSTQPTTIFMVVRPQTLTGTDVAFDGVNNRHTIEFASTQAYLEASSGGTPGSGANSVRADSTHVVAARFDSGSADLWLNSINQYTSQTIGTDSLNGITVGANSSLAEYFDGYIGEIIVYSKAMTDAQVTEISESLIAKWNTNSPENFPDLSWWLDASDESSVVLTGSNLVSSWYDKSGNGRNISQSTTSLQPTYTYGAGNGLNAVTFDRYDDRFSMDTALVTNNFTAFFAAAVDIERTWGIFFGNLQCGGSGMYFGHYVATAPTNHRSQFVQYTGCYSVVVNSTGANVAYTGNSKEYRIYELHFSTAASGGTVWLDGTLQTTFTGNAPVDNTGMVLGGFNYYNANGYSINGEMAEVIFFDRTVGSGDERTRIYNYLKNKWNAR